MPLETQQITIMPSTLETIDQGFYNHINDIFNISVTTNDGWKKVPVIWAGGERAFQIKNFKDVRDSYWQLKLPIISIERTSVAKDPAFKGGVQANIINDMLHPRGYRGGGLPVGRVINQEKTRNFANADQNRRYGDPRNVEKKFTRANKKIVYNTIYMPIPTYLNIMYSVTLRSEYQQHMNNMLSPFLTRTGQINSFVFIYNDHQFEAFIQQDFAQTNNVANLAEEERSFATKVDIKVLGYLMGDGENHSTPQSIVKENIVEIKPIRERTIIGDKKPWKTDNKKYRE